MVQNKRRHRTQHKTEAAKKSESSFDEEGKLEKQAVENGGNDGGDDDAAPVYDSPDSEITDSGNNNQFHSDLL